MGRRKDALVGTWRPIRFPVRERFSVEHREPAERALRELESFSRDGGHRFRKAGRYSRPVFPCDSAVAGRRQSRSLSGPPDKSEWDVQHEYVPPGFLVAREAMDRRENRGAYRPVCRSRLLWRATL